MRNEKYLYIDLHGKSVKEAKKLLSEKFALIKEENFTEFYIITGRGNHVGATGVRGVLKKALPRLLKPYCEDILKIDAEAGAYKILLKKDQTALKELLHAMNTFAVGSEDSKAHLVYFKKVEARAKEDNIPAMLLMANTYLTGEMKEFDDKEKAFYFFNRAKELGSIEAQTHLGVILMEGKHLKRNYKKGRRFLTASAEKQDAVAAFWLAKYYALGQGVKQNDQQALFWMQKSADQGYPMAEFNLGYSYLMANFTPEDNDLAFKYFNKAADHGHIEAKTYLARCHACGYGTLVDYTKAFHLYREAAVFDEPYAVYQTGQYLQLGRGVKQNFPAAFTYFLQGAELKDGDCQAKVAEAYFLGWGVGKDPKAGFQWAQRSAEQKNGFGYHAVSLAYRQGLGTSIDLIKADEYLERAANAECADAQFELALAIMKGCSADSMEKGMAWLQKAAELDHPKAIGLIKTINELVESRIAKPKLPAATASTAIASAYAQTIYQENKKASGKIQPTPPAAGKKSNEKEDSSPVYSGLRKGFLLGGE